MKYITSSLLIATCAFSAIAAPHEGSSKGSHDHDHAHAKAEQTTSAIAVIYPTEGHTVTGHVLFEKVSEGIRVSGEIKNLTPGKHGFHVHQYGDLRSENGTSAGGHFDPKKKPHGAPDGHARHVGDLGNIEADEDGVAEFSFVDKMLRFEGSASIIGRGLVVHAGEDDLESQPTGDAGGRVGVAVIGVANPEL